MRPAFFSRSHVLFMEPTNIFLIIIYKKTTLKLDLTILFTHLKIILLQYFQFLVISDIQKDP